MYKLMAARQPLVCVRDLCRKETCGHLNFTLSISRFGGGGQVYDKKIDLNRTQPIFPFTIGVLAGSEFKYLLTFSEISEKMQTEVVRTRHTIIKLAKTILQGTV